jgi:predicted ATP-dependent endonuclease of OLD family
MKLKEFRVQNYKKVRDTDWVTCRDLTVFVGKNEAGKSAIFRGLSKLNPSDGEKYDGLKEFPRRRYTDEFSSQDWPVASARFELTDDERAELAELCPELDQTSEVECTRHYSDRLNVGFLPAVEKAPPARREFAQVLEDALKQVRELVAEDGKGEAVGAIKTAIGNALEPVRTAQAKLKSPQAQQAVPRTEIEQALNHVAGQANEAWQKTLLQPIAALFEGLIVRAKAGEGLDAARKWVEENMPRFVYFDRYDVIDSAVHLPTFSQQLNGNPSAPKLRTTRCLFEHVGLDVKRLASLGSHQAGQGPDDQIRRLIDERAIHFSSASNAMTEKFATWWEQRRHKFRYQVDGEYFRVWVSDDLDPSEIELDQRSQGMQYFFSFFIVFLVEAKDAHENAILLLDEPGLHMHGTAQAKLLEFFGRLAQENQTLYSTHSPFMIDGDHLERARVVHEATDGTTKVSEDVWPRDKDSLFPLQAGLGYQLAQSLFVSKRQLLVEGITDLWLLKAFDHALRVKGMETLRDDLVIVPCAGVGKLLPLASMLLGHDVEVAALLDGDEPGRREGKKLVEKLFVGNSSRCLFVGDFLHHNGAELEDIFPEDYYLSAVGTAYSKGKLKLSAEEKKIPGIVDRTAAMLERLQLGRFEKWRPAAALRDQIVAKPDDVPEEVLRVASEIFRAVNRAVEAA